jgi:hypothetical protein
MSIILIAQPEGAVRELLHIVLDLHGHESRDHDQPSTFDPDTLDALILEPARPDCLLHAHLVRDARPDLPIVCVSSQPPTPEVKDLQPVAYLLMPFRLADLDGALRLALGG